jgi:hypothetical protein
VVSKEGDGVIPDESRAPNPKRVLAGRLNRAKRKGLSEQGRARLRLAAMRVQPWRFATGPRTTAGKAKAAANGKKRQKGTKSVREIRAELADIGDLIRQLREVRNAVGPLAMV